MMGQPASTSITTKACGSSALVSRVTRRRSSRAMRTPRSSSPCTRSCTVWRSRSRARPESARGCLARRALGRGAARSGHRRRSPRRGDDAACDRDLAALAVADGAGAKEDPRGQPAGGDLRLESEAPREVRGTSRGAPRVLQAPQFERGPTLLAPATIPASVSVMLENAANVRGDFA